jgi:hypothetical protein
MGLSFSAVFAAAQETYPPETPLPPDPSRPQTVPLPQMAQGTADPLDGEVPPESPGADDSAYVEPAGEPEEFPAPEVVLPTEPVSLPQKIGSAVYGYFSAPGATRRREPLRYFDWEPFSVNAGVANNLIGASDILQETIRINVAELVSRGGEDGFAFNTDLMVKSAVNFNGDTKGFGFFIGADGRLDLGVSGTLLSLLAQGNAGNTSVNGGLTVSGAVFAEMGFHRYFDVGKWRVDIRPAWFVPVLYVPESEVSVTLDTEDNITVGSFGAVTAYLPVSLDKPGINMFNNWGGLDFSVAVEYALFPIIDVGLDLTHIPFMPSRLSNKVSASIDDNILDGASIIDIIQDGLDLNFSPDYTLEDAEIYVMRPLRVKTWALYRPFRTDILGIKPHAGLTALTPSGKIHFNMGLEIELNVGRVLFLTVRSGREDGIWRHGANVGVNLRVFQLNIDATFASPEYLAAWSGRGLSVGAGIHFGF